jgi:hypothetical protein
MIGQLVDNDDVLYTRLNEEGFGAIRQIGTWFSPRFKSQNNAPANSKLVQYCHCDKIVRSRLINLASVVLHVAELQEPSVY